ncbi:MAG: hypothetical protein ACRDS9_12055 [Pseudonocardiaceae bacterium]
MPTYVMTLNVGTDTYRVTHDGADRRVGGPYIATSTTRIIRAHSLDQLSARVHALYV